MGHRGGIFATKIFVHRLSLRRLCDAVVVEPEKLAVLVRFQECIVVPRVKVATMYKHPASDQLYILQQPENRHTRVRHIPIPRPCQHHLLGMVRRQRLRGTRSGR
jgi:hypothetical protein